MLQKQSEILCRCEDVKDVDSVVKSAKIPAILIYFALVSHLSGRLGIKNGNPAWCEDANVALKSEILQGSSHFDLLFPDVTYMVWGAFKINYLVILIYMH